MRKRGLAHAQHILVYTAMHRAIKPFNFGINICNFPEIVYQCRFVFSRTVLGFEGMKSTFIMQGEFSKDV